MECNWAIEPYTRVGPLQFRILRSDVHKILKGTPFQFKRAQSSNTTDSFRGLSIFVCYDAEERCSAVEFADTALVIPHYKNQRLLGIEFNNLKNILERDDPNLEISADGLTSYLLGIGAYVPSALKDKSPEVESIIVFKRGYYD